MQSQNSDSKQRTWTDIATQFFLGAVLGLVFSVIPLFCISVSTLSLTTIQIVAIAVGLAAFCATLSAIFGNRFLSLLTTCLDSLPPVS
ncbi:hypothetical protein MiSe_92100 [Microseira wollei NIES-4236]|uniref:Uncharacterized protein n=1 Tax=Microseira wollei NIES-4236 TaxID=2530354 RepID=A0AAV3XRH2_9CYAN|nr:hypothetical protein MiSe_92100 [Microseira wollei NIES-4236]